MVCIRRIRAGKCEIWGRTDANGRGGLFADLRGLDAAYASSKAGLVKIFDRIAQDGLSVIPDAISHLVHEGGQIWEFIKGDLRVFYFKDGGRVVICTQAIIKKGQKADTQATNRAIAFRDEYLEAKRLGQLNRLERPR